MKNHLKLIILLLALGFLIAACSKATTPDAYDSNGNAIKISDYAGKWIVVNYWAAWCKPCLTELPELNNVYTADKDWVAVFGVSYDAMTNEEINRFATKLGIKFPLLQSFPVTRWGIDDISVLPMTLVISPQGKLVKILHGPQTKASLEAVLGLPAVATAQATKQP